MAAFLLGLTGIYFVNKIKKNQIQKGGVPHATTKDSYGFQNSDFLVKIIFSDYRKEDIDNYESGSEIPGDFDGLTFIQTDGDNGFFFLNHEIYPGGSVSRLTYQDGMVVKSELWKGSLARPCSNHKTPWNTILTNEEYMSSDKGLGYVYELDPYDRNNFKKLEGLGRMWHENTLPVPDSTVPGGYYFLTTDDRSMIQEGGSLYKFVPNQSQDLTNGSLYVYQATNEGTWLDDQVSGEWILIQDPTDIKKYNQEGTPYYKMEDLEYNTQDGCVYICVGGMKDGNLGGIYKFNPEDNSMQRWLKCENTNGKLINPDNIDIDNQGNLYIGEDKRSSNISIYGNNRLVKVNYQNPDNLEVMLIGADHIGEVTGVLLSPDQTKLWVNWQHGNDSDLGYFNELIEINLNN